MNRPGDWNCRTCNHLNFQRRDTCQRCGDPRPGISSSLFRGIAGTTTTTGFSSSLGLFGDPRPGTTTSPGPDVRPGDWYCLINNCATHNFANRSTCFKCGAPKDEASAGRGGFGLIGGGAAASSSGGNSRFGWKSGDWICTRLGCNEHNFASRTECFRCNAPRELFGSSWSSHS